MTGERPGARALSRARPVLTLWAFRVGAGLVVSYPAARTLSAFSPSPDGDALLFAPGGLHLMEALRLGWRPLGAAAESTSAVGLGLAFAGLFPLAASLALLAHPRATVPEAAARAAEALPGLLLLGGATVLAQGAVAVFSSMALSQLSYSLGSLANEKTADLLVLLAGLVVLSVVLTLGLVQDLARAAIVHHRMRPVGAAIVGLRALVARPGAVARGWLGPAGLGVALVGATAWAVGAIDVSRPGAGRIAAALALHQATVLVLAGLRVRWLSRTLILVAGLAPGGVAVREP